MYAFPTWHAFTATGKCRAPHDHTMKHLAGANLLRASNSRPSGDDLCVKSRSVEAAAGLPITEIFSRYGEAHFRDGERRVIARLVAGQPVVLATGGGAFADAGFEPWVRGRFEQISAHEAEHVSFLKGALGGAATQPCTYNL